MVLAHIVVKSVPGGIVVVLGLSVLPHVQERLRRTHPCGGIAPDRLSDGPVVEGTGTAR